MWAIHSGMKKKKSFHNFLGGHFLTSYYYIQKLKARYFRLALLILELPQQEFCLHLNVSQCAITESSSRFVATIYNPRSHQVTTYVRLPVMNGVYTVLDPDGITHIFIIDSR